MIDLDLINNILRLPYRQRLSLILNELGAGLAGRGDDLNKIIRDADPALKATDKVLKILAQQNRVLANLARDGDTIMAPLARERDKVADFVVQANTTAQATAERSRDLEANLQRLPQFLRELKPTMTRLGSLSDEFTPVLSDVGKVAPDLSRFIKELGPFSTQATPAVVSLGDASVVGRSALLKSQADHRGPARVRDAGATALDEPGSAPDELQGHRWRRAPDGLPLLPSGRDQRVRRVRSLPARPARREPLLHVRRDERPGVQRELHRAGDAVGVESLGAGVARQHRPRDGPRTWRSRTPSCAG